MKIRVESPIDAEILWAWELFARDAGLQWESVQQGQDLLISEDPGADILLSRRFRELYCARVFNHEKVVPEEPLIRCKTGEPDHLSTAFYMVNAIQEYGSDRMDAYGRFPFEASYQYRFKAITENLVSDGFRQLFIEQKLGVWPDSPSNVFVSHDVDRVNHAWRENGKHALKKGRIDRFVGLAARQLLSKPDWCNTSEIIEINRAAVVPAVFFWIPVKSAAGDDPPEADYRLTDKHVQDSWWQIEHEPEYENGLHTSTQGTVTADIKLFPGPVRANRNHFLKYRLPEFFDELAAASVQVDCSLGWSSVIGFRNSYGHPFRPWSVGKRTTLDILEVPLHLMDTTFQHYKTGAESGPNAAQRQMVSFLNKHSQNATISLLWHNNSFAGGVYDGYRETYQNLLDTSRKLGIKAVGLDTLINKFG